MYQASKIFLIGFMGSGKSTKGKKLASHLNWSFLDLDEKIENLAGMKIPDIFSQKGEPYFRQIESEALHGTLSETNTVISTGGGTPCFDDNMDFMIANGLTIYLKATPARLENRLTHSGHERPLLKDIDKKSLKEFIAMKLAEREKWYDRAEIIIDIFNTDLSDLYSLVKNWIRE
jgi:shikimate kinase